MFTIDHFSTMADIFIGLQNLLDHGSSRDLSLIGEILQNYSGQGADVDGKGTHFSEIVMEVAAVYAEASSNIREEPIEYKGKFRDEGRFDLVMLAANLSIGCTDKQVNSLFLALMAAKKKILAETEEPEEGDAPMLQAVKPVPKPKRKARKAA